MDDCGRSLFEDHTSLSVTKVKTRHFTYSSSKSKHYPEIARTHHGFYLMNSVAKDFVGAARDSLCGNCLDIDVRRPFCGPECSRSSSGIVTRVCYGHAETLYQLLTTALEENCHLCSLVLESIRKYYVLTSNKKNVIDDWDYVDDLDASDDSESELEPDLTGHYAHFFHQGDAKFGDLSSTDRPIILEFVFRQPRRDESASRCIDIIVHWTQTGGRARLRSSALDLVSQLPGRFCLKLSDINLIALK